MKLARKKQRKKNLGSSAKNTTRTILSRSQWMSLSVNSKLINLGTQKITTLLVMSNLSEAPSLENVHKKEISMYLRKVRKIVTITITKVIVKNVSQDVEVVAVNAEIVAVNVEVAVDAAVVIAPLVNTTESVARKTKTKLPELLKDKTNLRMNRKEKVHLKSAKTNAVLSVAIAVVVAVEVIITIRIAVVETNLLVALRSAITSTGNKKTMKVETKRLRRTMSSKNLTASRSPEETR